MSSAINPFLYSLLSKRFRRGFRDLRIKTFSNCRKLFLNSLRVSRTTRINNGNNNCNRIKKSSIIEGFSLTPLTTHKYLSKPESTIVYEQNVDPITLIAKPARSPSVVASSKDENSTKNLENEMFILAVQLNATNIEENRSRLRSKNQNCLTDKKEFNHIKLGRIQNSKTFESIDTLSGQSSYNKLMKRGGKESGIRYKKVQRENRIKKNNIEIIINPTTTFHYPHPKTTTPINEQTKLPRCPVVNDLREVGVTLLTDISDV